MSVDVRGHTCRSVLCLVLMAMSPPLDEAKSVVGCAHVKTVDHHMDSPWIHGEFALPTWTPSWTWGPIAYPLESVESGIMCTVQYDTVLYCIMLQYALV